MRINGSYYVRHLLGMAIVGILIYATMALFGHYYVEGVGYSTIQDILSDKSFPLYLLLVLFILKLLATSLTLGSGGSGGIFSPSLFLGATLGGAYGLILVRLFPELPISPSAFAVAGMAGMVGGATGAAMTSIVMIFEMTLDYSVVLPMTITVAISYGFRKLLSGESIYTQKLARRGHTIPDSLRASLIHAKCAGDIMDTRFVVLPASLSFAEMASRVNLEDQSLTNILVEDGEVITSLISRETALSLLARRPWPDTLGDAAGNDLLAVTRKTSIMGLISRIFSHEISFVLVLSEGTSPLARNVRGVITKERLAEFVTEAAEQFSS